MSATVAALYRYPVKSMLGERLEQAEIGERGVAGDRGFAVIDVGTGMVASAKQPRKWGWLLGCSAVATGDGVTITLPDGEQVSSTAGHIDDVLSDFAERPVLLSGSPPPAPRLERLWPDVAGLAPQDVIEAAGPVTPMAAAAPGTFFDYAPLHVVTTATMRALGGVAVERFRPTVVLDVPGSEFVENAWPGRRLTIGDAVLEVITVTPRCAVPSLHHGAAPADPEVLRSVVARNRIPVGTGRFACAGVYARVITPGVLAEGTPAYC